MRDIGLAITPMAYFAQFALDVPAVAMVTASHNDNGWTGVKMGAARPVTFGPEEMGRLRDIVLAGAFRYGGGGAYRFVEDFPARYIAELTDRPKLKRKLKVVAACGNGTAGAFAPRLLSRARLPRSSRSTASSTSPSRATTPIPKTCTCCTRWRRR